MVKHHDYQQVGKEKVNFFPGLVVHDPGKSEQESRVRNWHRGHGGTLFTVLSLMACSSSVLILPKGSAKPHGLGPPTSIINLEDAHRFAYKSVL